MHQVGTSSLLMYMMHGHTYIELNIDFQLLSVDFKQAFDSINRTYLYESLKEFGIPKKLVKLIKMMLQDSDGKVKIQGQLTEVFCLERDLGQHGLVCYWRR